MDRSRKDMLQNILIVLLSLSALLLMMQAWQFFPLRSSAGPQNTTAGLQAKLTDFSAPLRFSVTGAYGRYGDLSMTTAEEDFAQPGSLLREALGSAGSPAACTEEDFRRALATDCAYYDFETVMPAPVLAGLVGAELPAALEGSAPRQLLLSVRGEATDLYLTDGTVFLRCATQVVASDLQEMVSAYPLGGAAFAYELEAPLSPYSLLPTGQLPACPLLTAENPLTDEELLLSQLEFNPRTNFRYTESDGTTVVQEEERTLRRAGDGTITYESGGSTALTVAAEGASATAREAALGAFRLLDRLFPGGSALCLEEVLRDGEDWLISFDYHYDGTRVRRSNGLSAAQVRISGTTVKSFSLWPRSCSAADGESLLLPLNQAVAIARPLEGRELVIRYIDSGDRQLSAVWLAE